jgi:hypothetical protein
MTNILDKSCRENQDTHFMFNSFFFENHTIYEIMSKNMVQPERPQMTSQHGAYKSHAGLARLYIHAHAPGHTQTRAHTDTQICNICCFSTAIVITNVPRYVICALSVLLFIAATICHDFLFIKADPSRQPGIAGGEHDSGIGFSVAAAIINALMHFYSEFVCR